jgi:hypothetical protein
MGRRWTDEDLLSLKCLAQKQPAPKIAEIMDRPVGGVVFKAYTLKLPLKPRDRISDREEGRQGQKEAAN